jgi:hypothetical protein
MFREGNKFMWDGEFYETHEAAEAKLKEYEANDFETQLVEQGGRFLVYTRRVVTEIVLEGEAPLG